MTDIYEALVDNAGKQVTLSLNASPKEAGARATVVVPTDDERELYYFNWVQGNIEKVAKATAAASATCTSPTWASTGSTSS